VSTYALDGVATAAGVVLVASQLLHGLEHGLLLAVLAGTYVVWAAGLRAGMGANWTLLTATGTSTNALSKAAYDLTRRRMGTVPVQKIATAAGYAGTELVKEVPYYVGAFGAVAVAGSLSSTDALVFLAGTNLGAAAYEYALARGTRALLRLTAHP
jgi:hypothetical protein